jgi:catechol 2,3-dioxygenase-like lactoylglutathione lyase family enzyme
MPNVTGVLESSLYVQDLQRSVEFYTDLFGFERLAFDARFCAFSVAQTQVLLLFEKGSSNQPMPIPGGVIPPHDGSGSLHVAFSIRATEWDNWEAKLKSSGIEVESVVEWPRGGKSLYFHDPDGHLVELVTPGCWAIY